MAGKGPVKSARAIAGCILLAFFFLTRTVASISHHSENFRKELKPQITCSSKEYFCKTFCLDKQCVSIDIDAVRSLYPNLLQPINDARQKLIHQEGHFLENRAKGENPNSDFDKCCPTKLIFSNNSHLVNIHGVNCMIIRTDVLHQLIPMGICLKNGACKDCRIRHRTMSILVVNYDDLSFPLKFEQFSIPLYCTCNN